MIGWASWFAGGSDGAAAVQAGARTTYYFARLADFEQSPWLIAALIGVVALAAGYTIWLYRRDTVEQRRPIAVLLVLLRLGTLAAALFYFLGLERRTERQIVHPSRVVLLIDTSQSMTEPADAEGQSAVATSRMEQVVRELERGTLLPQLRKTHDVLVARFDRELGRIVTLHREQLTESDGATIQRTEDANGQDAAETSDGQKPVNWTEQLRPQGDETRLGGALRRLILEERNSPLSAVIVATDGAQNAGLDPGTAVELAAESKIPIFTIGLGSDVRPASIRVSDFVAPPRAFPGDGFNITGYVQPNNYQRSTVTAELYSRDASEKDGLGTLEQQQRVQLGADGEIVPVKFEIKSDKTGKRTYHFRLTDVSGDYNLADNQQEADVEVVDRKTQVLLLASAATREYQFLRNQLRRDKDMIVDVLLQSGSSGISQDSRQILTEFPSTKEALYAYDAIVAFDPDWTRLAADPVRRDEILQLVEKWVAEEAGGLIVVAGPVHGDALARTPELSLMRGLYPVTFQRRLSQLTDSQFGSTTPLAVRFTPEGVDAEFLWVENDRQNSSDAWDSFPGVFGYYDVKEAKPGATIYAFVTDSDSLTVNDGNIYMAGQIYGSGRVFYLGSGELWRLREYEEAYFERIYTKLIRHVSQGRLLRGSARGVLLVERDRYRPGETVVLRAQLADAQHEPLVLPHVALQVTQPDGTTKTVSLAVDENRKGMYLGHFAALQEGSYRLDLPVPDSVSDQLSRRFQVLGSNPERENPQRNNQMLGEIATRTNAVYYRGLSAIRGGEGAPALVGQLRDRSETITLTGAPDEVFKRSQMYWLLGILCGCLSLEWLIRRLCKLA